MATLSAWAIGNLALRNPLVSLLITIGLTLGSWADARAGHPAPPVPTPLRYGPDPVQSIDVWPARASSHPTPLVLFVHGGAWSLGSKDNATGRAKIAHFAARNFAFATIDYRLVPAARVEDQAADLAHALACLLAQADRLGIDPRRVIVMGHSAGAHLAALVGTDPRWLHDVGLTFDAIAGIVAIDGAAYDVPRQMRDAPRLLATLYAQAFGNDPERQRALSPSWQTAAPNVTNWLLLHVNRPDGTRQTEALAAALRRAGSTVDVVPLPGSGMSGHVAANRSMGDPTYPGTTAVDQWIDRVLAGRTLAARQMAPA